MTGDLPRRVRAALTVVLIASCDGDVSERLQSGRVLALHGLQGRWVGPVVPADRFCGPATQGSMSIGAKGFGFDPFQSTTIIQGVVEKDGHLIGTLTRQSADHHDLSVSFEGSASAAGAETIDGTLTSGRCRWKVTLRRG